MAFNKETLGLRIGEIRRRRGLSQMALAEQIEKAPTFISSIETGQRTERTSGRAFDRQHRKFGANLQFFLCHCYF